MDKLNNRPSTSATNSFYSNNKTTDNNGNKNSAQSFLRSINNNKITENHLKQARNQAKPYNKPFNNTGNVGGSNIKSSGASNKLAPIFIRTVNCKCYLISDSRFVVNPSEYHSKLIDVFKTIPSKSYDPDTKLWSFLIKDYELLFKNCESLKPNIVIEQIPKNVLRLCSQPKDKLDYSCLVSIEPKLVETLLPFQKEGVCFGINKHGRVLIADEMGLGKTYQALAIADFYKEEWPLLICTTASTRDSWTNHIKNLLPSVACHHIKSLISNNDYVDEAKILITSYTMLEKNVDKLLQMNFGVLIYDESHTLKNQKAKCTMMADRLAKKAKRIILISGTPALSRPLELFTQLKMLDRNFFNFMDFTTRYCEGKQTAYGWNATGQSNLQELNVVLSRKFMIRRVKADVLPQLAEKLRETVILDPSQLKTNDNTELNSYADCLSQCKDGRKKEEILLKYYAETANVKKDAVCNYIQNLIKDKLKFIVFAHHSIMMNAICKRLDRLKIDYIRIDGSTRSDLRTEYVTKFQENHSCKVAVLSLRACNAGITLTAADLIIFAELDWNPSTLAQAESRAHRIGQQSTVTCRYLLANKTADDIIWAMLKNKQDVLNKAGVFCENLQNAECVAGPMTSHVIEDYFKKTNNSIVKNKEQIVQEKNTFEENHSEKKENSEVQNEENQNSMKEAEKPPTRNEFSSFFDDGDDVFCDLDY